MVAADCPSPLEKFVARATQLYTLPAVAMEVLQRTNCPKVDTAALKTCIERDPALVSKILRTVNSSLFGGVRDVTDLNQAITLLGIKPLKLLVLGFSLPPRLLSDIEQQTLVRYWKGALIKAIAARELAPNYDGIDADDAFLAGLLQDIGILVLLKELGEPYAEFLTRARNEQADIVMLELETLGFDHRLLSARMLQSWGLPESLWRPIAASTAPDDHSTGPNRWQPAAEALSTADAVAVLLAQHQPAALAELMHRRGQRDIAWWTGFAGRVQEHVEQMAGIFDVNAGEGEQFDEIVRAAHRQLAAEAEEAAVALVTGEQTRSWSERENLERAVEAFGNRALPTRQEAAAVTEGSGRRVSTLDVPATAAAIDEADPGLLGRLAAAVSACRRRRQPLSMALLAVDDFDELVFQRGTAVAADLAEVLREQMEPYLEPGQQALVSGDAELTLLLPAADRPLAVSTARRILDDARSGMLFSLGGHGHPITFSIGVASVALPAKNFPPGDLHEAARRCLFAVQSSGGQGVKSIDIY